MIFDKEAFSKLIHLTKDKDSVYVNEYGERYEKKIIGEYTYWEIIRII